MNVNLGLMSLKTGSGTVVNVWGWECDRRELIMYLYENDVGRSETGRFLMGMRKGSEKGRAWALCAPIPGRKGMEFYVICNMISCMLKSSIRTFDEKFDHDRRYQLKSDTMPFRTSP